MNDEPYKGVLLIPVSIPAALIESDDGDYEEIEERVLADAEWQLQSLIVEIRAARV